MTLKYWKIVMVSLVFAWAANAGWHYYQYLGSPERAAEILEEKRLEQVSEYKVMKDLASSELSRSVSETVRHKSSLAYAEACLAANAKAYYDCASLKRQDFQVSFVPVSAEDKPKIEAVPKVSAAEAEPPRFLNPNELL